MDTFKKFMTKPQLMESKPDLNDPEDVRRVIEKVEVIDSVDVDAIHSKFAEIAEEKAASRVLDKPEGQMSEAKLNKSKNVFSGFTDFTKSSDSPISDGKNQEANVSTANKSSINEKGVDIEEPNPYIDNDNFTAFFD
ncbi:unnamed protein product [Arctia plantaginis]|uniref:Uncharacterized protein n=1 Tax=Arctia plantaginis TaxID=874455 RepID=A0A8S0YYJ3_ARCPL|nr:unnamed protein product [Arctia plantaginis]